MEQLELMARVSRTEKAWAELSPFTNTAYDILLQGEEFWDPSIEWTRPLHWHVAGAA